MCLRWWRQMYTGCLWGRPRRKSGDNMKVDLKKKEWVTMAENWTPSILSSAVAGIFLSSMKSSSALLPSHLPGDTFHRQLEHEAGHSSLSSLSSSKVKNVWRCTSTLPYVYITWYLSTEHLNIGNKCSKTWLIGNSAMFQILVWTRVPKKRNSYKFIWLFKKPW
jgi:hypothetical protein